MILGPWGFNFAQQELEDGQARDRGVHEARAPDHEVRERTPDVWGLGLKRVLNMD